MKPNYILGLSAFYHDSAACLLRDGEIVAAAQEERFTRKKGDSSFPASAVDYCLRVAEIHQPDLDFVAFYDKPLLKFERILDTYMAVAPRGLRSFLKAGPLWIKNKLYTDSNLRSDLNYEGPILYSQHHESHAASAFLPSPFKEAVILTMDGVGEWATASIGIGRDIKDHTRWMNAALWGAWLRSGVIGVCLFLGILAGSWGLTRWHANHIQSLSETRAALEIEIQEARQTIERIEQDTWGHCQRKLAGLSSPLAIGN